MTGSPTARLVLSTSDPVDQARLRFAFSAYAALHGIRVLDGSGAEVTVLHGPAAGIPDSGAGQVTPAAGDRPRPLDSPAPAPDWAEGATLPAAEVAEAARARRAAGGVDAIAHGAREAG